HPSQSLTLPNSYGRVAVIGASHLFGKKLFFRSAPPTDFSQIVAPDAVTLIVGSTAFIAMTMSLCLTQYWSSDMWPYCQGPYISLPIDQRRTRKGSGCPLATRSRPMRVSADPLQYSTSS